MVYCWLKLLSLLGDGGELTNHATILGGPLGFVSRVLCSQAKVCHNPMRIVKHHCSVPDIIFTMSHLRLFMMDLGLFFIGHCGGLP